jgi:amidase
LGCEYPIVLTTAECLAQIEELESTLHAFQSVRRDEARAEAASVDPSLPLAGVPVAVKDNVNVAGLPTRHGSAATSDRAADQDDELVRRLRAAGCVVIGKTQMPELAVWPFTEPTAFPFPQNPVHPGMTPGGSTGGGAVAVAAGMAALALGSDGGGSIRVPAACCGLVGIKPGPGVVPLAGGMDSHWYGMTEFGPIARTAADAALMLDVLAGADRYRTLELPGSLRIAFSAAHPNLGVRAKPEIRRALDEAARALEHAGHGVRHVRVPYPPTLGMRFSNRWLAGIAQEADTVPAEKLEERTQAMAKRGAKIARKVKQAADDPFGERMRAWFADHDVLITPVLTRPPVPIGKWDGKGWVRTMLGVANWIYTVPWNLARLPAASVPFRGVGLQLVGPEGSEATLLALAAQIERLDES